MKIWKRRNKTMNMNERRGKISCNVSLKENVEISSISFLSRFPIFLAFSSPRLLSLGAERTLVYSFTTKKTLVRISNAFSWGSLCLESCKYWSRMEREESQRVASSLRCTLLHRFSIFMLKKGWKKKRQSTNLYHLIEDDKSTCRFLRTFLYRKSNRIFNFLWCHHDNESDENDLLA